MVHGGTATANTELEDLIGVADGPAAGNKICCRSFATANKVPGQLRRNPQFQLTIAMSTALDQADSSCDALRQA